MDMRVHSDAWRCSQASLKWQRHLYLGGLPILCRKPKRVHYKFRFYLLKVKRQVDTEWHPWLSRPTTCAGISKPLCFRLYASILAGPHRLRTMTETLDPAMLLLPSKIPLVAPVASSYFWLTDAFIRDAVSQPPPSPVPLTQGEWGAQADFLYIPIQWVPIKIFLNLPHHHHLIRSETTIHKI